MSIGLRLRALCLTAILAAGLLLPFADGLAFHSGTGTKLSHTTRLQSPDAPIQHGQTCALGVEAPKAVGAPAPEVPAEFVRSVAAAPAPLVTNAPPSDPLQRGAPPRAPPIDIAA